MNALLERLNASRRFARSVYAPHKLALRQSVPSPLRAMGVTAPLAPVSSASRSVAPRAVSVATRALSSAVLRPSSAALEPQFVTNLESQGSANLEVQDSVNLESQDSVNLESPQDSVNLESPQDSINLESPQEAAFPAESPLLESVQDLSLELAAPNELAPTEPLELDRVVTAEALTAQTPLEQPVAVTSPARVDPVRVDSSAELEPSAESVRVTESPTPATIALDAPETTANPSARAITAPPEPAGEMPSSEALPELERLEVAQPMPETLAVSPAQPLEPQPAILEAVRLEPQLAAPDLEVIEAAQDAVTLEPAMLKTSPAPIAVEPERIAPITAPVILEAAAPIVAVPPAADQSVPDPIQPPARGRVIEEFQARPPRNMPPRNQTPRAAEPEPATVSETPPRPPEEWARLLRQRFAQPGDEAFDDPVTPIAPAALEAAPSNSGAPVAVPSAILEPSEVIAAPMLEGQAAVITPTVITEDSSETESIRERSQAALQAIPEDMTKRSPRDWGLALIRRYTSADEAAAIGIEAYRDPSDAAATQTPPGEPARSVAARATVASPVSSSPTLSNPASSSAEQTVPIGLEAAVNPARRFVAPRIVSSTASSLRTVTASPIAPAQVQTARAQVARAQPAPQQRSAASPTPLERSSDALEVAPQIPASLEPNRSANAPFVSPPLEQPDLEVEAPLQSTLETNDLAAPQTAAAPADVNDAQTTRAAILPASEIVQSADVASNAAATLEPVNPAPAMLEPVTLSGATRRFLEPLVGFDPNEVSIYTGEGASRESRDLRADAAAQNGAVLMPDASNLETPAQLGLLAHELIHAAQQQRSAPADASAEPMSEAPFQASPLEPSRPFEAVSRRFVPALGSSDTRGSAQISSAGQFSNPSQFSNAVRQSSAPINEGISNFASEEDRARAAEARVAQIARAGPLSAAPASSVSASADPTNSPSSFNGLPAPWESLPSFESPSSDDGVVSLIGAGLSPQAWGGSATTNPSGYGGSVSSSNPSASSSSASSSSASGSAQAAETGRELPSGGGGASASPDLEQLAKQVYDVLKRRLQSDRRRGGL